MLNIRDIELDQIRIDGGTQPRAKIDMEVVNDYGTSFEMGATFPPIDVFFDGKEYWLADGFHRYHGARSASVHELPATVHSGTVRDAILFSLGCNDKHGLRRTNEDKRHSVMTLLNDEEWSKWSAREIGDKCGVSHQFVCNIREKLSTVDSFSEPTEVKYTTSTGKTATMPVRRSEPDSVEPERVSQPVMQETSPTVTEATLPHVSQNSGNNEWYTPVEYIEAAREVLAAIDLDPASCELANSNVKATRFFTAEDSGLEKQWNGRVWLNPPYGQPHIADFACKLIEEVTSKRTTAAVVLVNNATETDWGQSLLSGADAVCFKDGRIKFLNSSGVPANTPLQGQMFLYFGRQPAKFKDVFGKIGVCF